MARTTRPLQSHGELEGVKPASRFPGSLCTPPGDAARVPLFFRFMSLTYAQSLTARLPRWIFVVMVPTQVTYPVRGRNPCLWCPDCTGPRREGGMGDGCVAVVSLLLPYPDPYAKPTASCAQGGTCCNQRTRVSRRHLEQRKSKDDLGSKVGLDFRPKDKRLA